MQRAPLPFIIAALIALCGCHAHQKPASEPPTATAPDSRPAIAAVLRAHGEARRVCLTVYGKKTELDWSKFAGMVEAVPVAGCPDDFRDAWRDYSHAVTKYAKPSLSEIADAVKGPGLISAVERANAPAESWQAVLASARSHGVISADN